MSIIIILTILYILYLIIEANGNRKIRSSFTHIVHVNGTRGKSSTCRLIDAALRGGDYKVFCKTTGTSARMIDTEGIERPIIRKGNANIKEQIRILKEAAKQKADIVIIECMAIKPELQYISQNKILDADISIVTNVRRDHLEEMGPTLFDVAKSLGYVMPKEGHFITADERFIDYYKQLGEKSNTKVYLAENIDNDYGIDFMENVSIALELCKILGINKATAIERMRRYHKDPGVLKTYKIETENHTDISFINGFAINDPDSILIIFNYFQNKEIFKDKKFILLVNNRGDRAFRVQQHIEIIKKMLPDRVWISGEYKNFMKRKLLKGGFDESNVLIIDDYKLTDIQELRSDSIIFAIGNVAGYGERILEYIESIGDAIV